MRIIFSRKGFDGENGGVPSPIFPDGTMVSLPIPRKSQLNYGQITSPMMGFRHLGEIVEHLTRYRLSDSCCVHLDPDLDSKSISRDLGWRGIFGQSEKAQRELENEGVGVGDLFLFFGQFCRVEPDTNNQLRYVRRAERRQVMFGWLRVGDIFRLPDQTDRVPRWARYHPHLNYAKIEPVPNVIYVAADKLENGSETAGWGVFRSFCDELCLTCQDSSIGRDGKTKTLASLWRLPAWMNPWSDQTNPRPPLTHHRTKGCWEGSTETFAALQTAGRGQEFILNCDAYPEAWPWAKTLIEKCR